MRAISVKERQRPGDGIQRYWTPVLALPPRGIPLFWTSTHFSKILAGYYYGKHLQSVPLDTNAGYDFKCPNRANDTIHLSHLPVI